MSATARPEISIEALKAGDRGEFARLVEAYSAPIYRLALRMLAEQQAAEDVLQNTFLNVFTHVASFEGRSSLATWIYRIAANEALMAMRRKRPEVSLDDISEAEQPDLMPREFVDWADLPEDRLLSRESRGFLDRAIQALPGPLKVVFILRDLEGLSIREAAQALDLSEANVKTRLLRARLNLREQLSSYFRERVAPKEE